MLAGGLGLALACDLIVAREGASFGTPEINVGVFPFMIMALIYRNVGRKKTNELLLLGERIDAEEAERIGIVNRVVAADEFDAAVDEWAVKLASKSPVLMRLGKDAMYRQQDLAFDDALELLRTTSPWRSRPRTSRRASRRSSRSGSRSGRGGERPPSSGCCAALGARRTAARTARRRSRRGSAGGWGVEARLVGSPGEPRRSG